MSTGESAGDSVAGSMERSDEMESKKMMFHVDKVNKKCLDLSIYGTKMISFNTIKMNVAGSIEIAAEPLAPAGKAPLAMYIIFIVIVILCFLYVWLYSAYRCCKTKMAERKLAQEPEEAAAEEEKEAETPDVGDPWAHTTA